MLGDVAGFVFDLDGCVWEGERLSPGAAAALAALHAGGRGIAYLTNNSRATGADITVKLRRLGVTPAAPALTPLEILGTVIAERYGPSRVLVIGAPELAAVVEQAGHRVVDVKAWRAATVVAVGNDFELSYERLTAAFGVLHSTAEPFKNPDSIRVEFSPYSGESITFEGEGPAPRALRYSDQTYMRA